MLGILLLVTLGIVTAVYWWLRSRYSYWTSRGVVQPPHRIGFGHIRDLLYPGDVNIGQIYDKLYNSYPDRDALGVYQMIKPELLLRSPELVQRVLVNDFSSFHDNAFSVTEKQDPHMSQDPFFLKGDGWKSGRVKLVSALTPVRVKELFPISKLSAAKLDSYINDNLGKEIEGKELGYLFTMDNVSNSIFGIDCNCFTDSEAAFRVFADKQYKEMRSWWTGIFFMLSTSFFSFLSPQNGFTHTNKFIKEMVTQVVDFRTKNNFTRGDLIQYLIKKEGGNLHSLVTYGVIFFTEAFETSALVASSALYELALNPEVQDKLYEEVKAAYDSQGGDIDYETLNNLKYLECVVKEAQRKYFVAYFIYKQCTSPISLQIDGKSVEIERGTPVIIPMYSLQNDPNYFSDPERFDPERFSEEHGSSFPQYAYIPFGEGPRICPGMRFASTQVKLFLTSLLYKYRILRTERTPPKRTFSTESLILLSPVESEWMRFGKRT